MKLWRQPAACALIPITRTAFVCLSERQNADSKGCLKWLLVYFSLPHRSLNLCSVARCEGGKAGLKSILGPEGFAPWVLHPSPYPEQRGAASVPCLYLAVIMGRGKSDCILMPPVVKSKNNMHWDLQLFPTSRSFLILWSQNSQSVKAAWI